MVKIMNKKISILSILLIGILLINGCNNETSTSSSTSVDVIEYGIKLFQKKSTTIRLYLVY